MKEYKRLIWSILPILALSCMVVLIHFITDVFDANLYRLGIEPRVFSGLRGIALAPLIHSSWDHLLSNLGTFIVLGSALYYFHPKVASRALIALYLMSGIWVWIIARPSFHIGASGIVYGLAAFMFVAGVVSRKVPEMAVSLIVVLLYGSMVWGVLPLYPGISWESHLCGALAGAALAWYFGPKNKWKSRFYWDEEEEFELNHIADVEPEPEDKTNYFYTYKQGED